MLPEDSEIAVELLENSPEAMLALSPEQTVVYWNKGAEKTFGYTREEAIGQHLSDLIIPADQVQEEETLFNKVIESGRCNFQSLRRSKNGSLIPVDISTRVILDAQGGVKYVLSSKKDITDRKLAEEALEGSELRYRRLFESAKDGILILDEESGEIIDANPYLIEMLGVSKSDLTGKELWEIGPFKDIVASKLAFAELQRRGYIRYENLPLESSDGIIRQVEFVSNSYLTGERRVIQCNIRDITEHKLAEEQLRRTNQSLEGVVAELQTKTRELALMTQQLWQASKLATMGELAASIAHELNNPLATVGLRAEALMEELPADDPRFQSVKIISEEVERMASLVGNLLKFSRRRQPANSTLDLREELDNSLGFIEHYLSGRMVNVVRDFASDLPNVHADRQQLRQVFLNLITNASDAMPRGGTLTLRAFPGVLGDRPAVVIEFSDTGTGVQTGDLPKLWEPFFTTKPEGKGTGLGLAICRRTLEEHHGTIDIETSPGKGATVRLILPAADAGETDHE